MKRGALLCALLALFAGARMAAAQAPGTSDNPVPALSTSTVIGEIRVEPIPVFDPEVSGEDWWPFRIANKIHITTKKHVVRRELLLDPGGYWDPLKALESERNLRANGSFRFVSVSSAPSPGGRTDLLVRTQDSWTTNVQLSAGTEGGDEIFIYGAEENNLFGLNKQVSYYHVQKGPKISNDFRYTDPRLAGSRYRLASLYAKTSKGDSIGADVARPFFSLDTPYALGWGWTRLVDEDILYHNGEERSKFLERSRLVQMSYGWRLPADNTFVQRIEGGWFSEKHEFNSTADTLPGTLPLSRELSGPTVGYSWTQPQYIKETNVNRMERVEDYNMGNELRIFGGFMGVRTGSDRDRWIYSLTNQQGYRWAPGQFILGQVGATGRTVGGGWDNALLFANANLVWKTDWRYEQTWVAHFETAVGRELDGENQVILGGENGLRGYKNNSFVGAKSVLGNIENRFFFPREYFHLVKLGGTFFFDTGTVVPEGSGFSLSRAKSDIGFGLRLASTRSRSGGVFRIDVAYALDKGPAGGRVVVAIRGGQSFDFFNSSARRVRQTQSSRLNEIAPPSFPSIR